MRILDPVNKTFRKSVQTPRNQNESAALVDLVDPKIESLVSDLRDMRGFITRDNLQLDLLIFRISIPKIISTMNFSGVS